MSPCGGVHTILNKRKLPYLKTNTQRDNRGFNIFSVIILLFQCILPFSFTPVLGSGILENIRYWDDILLSYPLEIRDETIICSGNITISGNGNLTLVNSTLLIESPSNMSRKIIIQQGGIFRLYQSMVDSNNSYGYRIIFESASSGCFESSIIRGFGYYCITDIFAGLQVNYSELSIIDSVVYVTGNGITSSYGTISLVNTEFLPYHINENNGEIESVSSVYGYNSNFTIENCSFTGISNLTKENSSFGFVYIKGSFIINNTKFNQIRTSLTATESNSKVMNTEFYANCSYQDPILNVPLKPLTLKNCIIVNNKGPAVGCFGTNLTLVSSSIIGTPGIFLEPTPLKTTIYLVNSSFNTYQIQNDNGTIYDLRFFNIEVLSQKRLTGVENATIQIFDKDGLLSATNQTGLDGKIRDLQILYRSIQKQSNTFYGNHKVRVSKENVIMPDIQINLDLERNITVFFDDIAPFLNITYPTEGLLTNASEINIIGTTEIDARLLINNRSVSNDKGIINSTYFLDEGINKIILQSIDVVGNIQETSFNVTSIRWLPSLQVFTPFDMTIINTSQILISGWTNGSRLEIDNVPVQLNSTGNFSFLYVFSSEGMNIIIIRSWNIVNLSEYIRLRITYDKTPPEIIIRNPNNGSVLNNPKVTITGDAIGASTLKINSILVSISNMDTFNYDVVLHEGENSFIFQAWDRAGNVNNTSITVFLDTLIWINISEPDDNLLTRIQNISISGETEPGAIVKINDQLVNNINGTFLTSLFFSEGSWIIIINSSDQAGNSLQRLIHVIVDLTPPNLTILAPLEKEVNISKVILIIHSENNISIMVNGTNMIPSGYGNYTLALNLVNGSNNFTVTAKDSAGNNISMILEIVYHPPDQLIPDNPETSNMDNWIYYLVSIPMIVLIIIIVVMYRKKNNKVRP